MAVPAQTTQAVGRIGIREDLEDAIYNISPMDVPFLSAIGRGKAENTYVEYQIDSLVAASAQNKTIQGDDLTNENRPATTRVGTYTQIMKKVVGTSTTAQAVKTAGRANEHSYQLAKAGKELKRDMEMRFTGNFASVAPLSGTPGETAGALAWMTTNVSRGAAGANGGYTAGIVAAATNGTQRASTEALLKAQLASAWNNGGEPSLVVMSLAQKQIAAAFTGLATSRRESGNKKLTIVAGADVYVSDVGEVRFVPDRFCSTRDALIVDPSLWEVAVLDPMQNKALATTGLSDRMAIYTEVALKCHQEAGNAVVADLS